MNREYKPYTFPVPASLRLQSCIRLGLWVLSWTLGLLVVRPLLGSPAWLQGWPAWLGGVLAIGCLIAPGWQWREKP